MSRTYERILEAAQADAWLIDPTRATAMLNALALRLELGARSGPYLSDEQREANEIRARVSTIPMPPQGKQNKVKNIAVIPLVGAILPRGDMMSEMSGGGAVNLTRFQSEFQRAANDESVGAILLEIDSPGGSAALVQETAAMIRAAQRPSRPIVASCNSVACSAAYWLASAADTISVTPSGMVGSVGAYLLHMDVSKQAEMEGVKPTFIFEGAHKVEGNPYEELGETARAELQSFVRAAYNDFTADVARYRGANVRDVRADPDTTDGAHFGGGRAYSPNQLRDMKMIGRGKMVDRVETIQQTIERLMGRSTSRSTTKARLDFI